MWRRSKSGERRLCGSALNVSTDLVSIDISSSGWPQTAQKFHT